MPREGYECFNHSGSSFVVWTGAERSPGYHTANLVSKHYHYTEMTEPVIIVGQRMLIHQGEGKFTAYILKSSTNANKVRAYLSSRYSGGFDTLTEEMVVGLYNNFGSRKQELDINNKADRNTLIRSYGLVKCNAGVIIPGKPPVITPPHIRPGSGIQTQPIRTFTTNSSTFHIDITYKTFLCYGSINDTLSRGKVKLYLYRDGYLVDTILDIDYNDERSITKTYEGYLAGKYELVMELEDTYQDIKNIYFEAKTQIREGRTEVSGTGERDESKTTLKVVDGSGVPVNVDGKLEIILDCNGTCRECIRLEVPKGETYTLTGDFFKPNGVTTGGPLGGGAALELNEGVVKYDVITRAFPPGEPIKGGSGGESGIIIPDIELPIPDWGIGDTEIDEGEGEPTTRPDQYFWADVITIKSADQPQTDTGAIDEVIKSNLCYPLGTYMDMDVSGMDYNTFLDANKDLQLDKLITGEIEMHLTNPSNSDITVIFDFEVDDDFEGCGGGGDIRYFGGGFEFWGYDRIAGDGIEDVTAVSKLDINIDEYLPDHEVIGGCNGSYAEVHVRHLGKIVETIKVDEDTTPRIELGNLFRYGDSDFDIEIITHQKGEVDPRGYDLRSIFTIRDFKLNTMFELNADNFDSKLDFYINDGLKFTSDKVGSGEHYFNVNKGLNRYKFVFSTNHYNYNWDYVEIPWVRLTNWLCDAHEVIPYCDKGRGDKCVEALIGCVLGLLPKPIPKGCVIITYYDQETGKVLKQFTRYGYKAGEYVINAEIFPEFEIMGDVSKTVVVDETGICTPVDFYYRRTYRRCVYVYHMDCETGLILRKVPYYNLVPGKHYFNPIEIPNYRARIIDPIEFEAINTLIPIECEPIYICYDWVGDKNPYLDCLYVIHREYGNIENILETEQLINLVGGQLEVHAKEYTGYRVIGPKVKFVNMRDITDPLECLEVTFDYEKIPLDCVIVKFVDRVSEEILDTDFYYGLLPGEYTYNAKAFDGYKLVSERSYTILLIEEMITDDCKELTFLYEPISKGCALGKKIWLFT